MEHSLDDIDRLTERVIACAIEVHRQMGPGLREAIAACANSSSSICWWSSN